MSTMTFASKTLIEHLLRGAFGVTALALAIHVSSLHPILALGLGVCMLVAFRGCPVCWTTGLIETLRNRYSAG